MKTLKADQVVTIYFSKDRPLQLDLALTSNQKKSVDWDFQQEVVIYKASDERYEKAYQRVAQEHSSVTFILQKNFKSDLLGALKGFKYLLLVVDDNIFTSEYSLNEIVNSLENVRYTLGFSLRLGNNTQVCYPIAKVNDMPTLRHLSGNFSDIEFEEHEDINDTCSFNWTSSQVGDFGYPLEVSSSVYRIKDLIQLLSLLPFDTPNSLEWGLSCNAQHFAHFTPLMLCYEKSIAFCDPLNKVQTENNNRAGMDQKYSLLSLLKIFEDGGRIDYEPFDNFISNGCHQEVDFAFYYA